MLSGKLSFEEFPITSDKSISWSMSFSSSATFGLGNLEKSGGSTSGFFFSIKNSS